MTIIRTLESLDLVKWVIIFLCGSAILYLVSQFFFHERPIKLEQLLVCALGGSAIPSGIDLFWGAFNPAHLGITSLGELHRVDLGVGAFAVIYLGCSAVFLSIKDNS